MKSLIVSAMQRAVIAVPLLTAEHFHPGQNTITIRGEHQDIYFYPTRGEQRTSVLFLPGDGGWREFAVTIASNLAASGYDAYGIDTKQYLSSFTRPR